MLKSESAHSELKNLIPAVRCSEISLASEAKNIYNLGLQKRSIFSSGGNENTVDIPNEQDLSQQKACIEKNIESLKIELKDREEQLKKLTKISHISDVKRESYSYESKLQRKITKTTFDLDSPADIVAGFCVQDDIKTFHIDAKKHSQFFITNHLWDLIDQQKQE